KNIRRFRGPNGVVGQNEFLYLRIVSRSGRFHFRDRKSFRLRIGVRIKDRLRHCIRARPETETAHFLRIRFARDRVREMRNSTGMRRRLPAREAGDREIETSPKKVDGTTLAAKARAKFFEDAV